MLKTRFSEFVACGDILVFYEKILIKFFRIFRVKQGKSWTLTLQIYTVPYFTFTMFNLGILKTYLLNWTYPEGKLPSGYVQFLIFSKDTYLRGIYNGILK